MGKSYWCEWEASFKQQVIAEHTGRDWQHAAWEVFDLYRYLVKPSDVPYVKNSYKSNRKGKCIEGQIYKSLSRVFIKEAI